MKEGQILLQPPGNVGFAAPRKSAEAEAKFIRLDGENAQRNTIVDVVPRCSKRT